MMKTLATLDRPSWLPSSAWPWDAHALNLRQGRIAVTDMGRGPTLLFVHVGTWSFASGTAFPSSFSFTNRFSIWAFRVLASSEE